MNPRKRKPDSDQNQPTKNPPVLAGPSSAVRMDSYTSKAFKPPGRLSDLNLELASDPRATPALVTALQQVGLARGRVPSSLASLSFSSTMEAMGKSLTQTEQGLESIYTALPNSLPSDDFEIDTESWVESIAGSDGNTIFLRVTRPVVKGGLLPCVVFFHPGGMTMGTFNNTVNIRWCTSLAAAGVVCVAVNFRNAWDGDNNQHNPFPAGLNDCCDAVKYVHANRESFRIRNLILQGFDGGANLAFAVTLKAKREEWLYQINGVYACAPYISNAYTWLDERKLRELPSLIENNGYYLHTTPRAYMAHVYTPKSADAANPLAWPYHATIADLEGLPPHVLAMDELDPLRDEGTAYCRKLVKAGVSAVGHVNIGATHCASLTLRRAVPELNREAIRSIVGFARTL